MDTKTVIKYVAIAAGIYILYAWLKNNGYLDSILGTHPAVTAATDAAKTVDSATAAAQKAAADLAAAQATGDAQKIAQATAAKVAAVMAAQKAADAASAAHAALVKACSDGGGTWDAASSTCAPNTVHHSGEDPMQAAANKLIAAAGGHTSYGVDEWNYYLGLANPSATVTDLGLPRDASGKTQPMDALTYLQRRVAAGLPVGMSGLGMHAARNWWDNLRFDGSIQ